MDRKITCANTIPSPLRYCGRVFTPEEIFRIRHIISSNPELSRYKLSKEVCNDLDWVRHDGRQKDMSCRVAMLRMEKDGLITLPPPKIERINNNSRPRFSARSDPNAPLTVSAGQLGELMFLPVDTKKDSSLWNELIERYHYLGYTPLPGAQIRYLVFAGNHLLAAMGFGAAAWSIAPRDRFIGWDRQLRVQNLHLVVNNARFLILPWVRSKYLASRILARAARVLPAHWNARYGYKPVLLETFVQKDRFRGTCYRASNWICVGQTKGRGKLERQNRCVLPVKEIFLYPLHTRFRRILCTPTKGNEF